MKPYELVSQSGKCCGDQKAKLALIMYLRSSSFKMHFKIGIVVRVLQLRLVVAKVLASIPPPPLKGRMLVEPFKIHPKICHI